MTDIISNKGKRKRQREKGKLRMDKLRKIARIQLGDRV